MVGDVSSGNGEPRVVLVHNMASPYRLPIFEELARHVDLTVLFCTRNVASREWQPDLEQFEFDYHILNNVSVGAFILNPSLHRQLARIEFDLCLIGVDRKNLQATLTVLTYCRRRLIPVVMWAEHIEPETGFGDPPFYKRIKRRFSNTFQQWIFSKAAAFVAYSEMTKAYLERRGVESQDIYVGGQVMPEVCIPQTKNGTEESDEFVFLYLGYLRKAKGIHHLIRAFTQADIDNAILRVAGSGPYKQQLKELAAGRDRIEFVGHVQGTEKARCYESADVLVLPTLRDTWGLVVNEAISFGLPVIVTEAAGSKQLVRDAGVGLIVEPGDEHGLSSALEEMFVDMPSRKEYAERAKDTSQATSVEHGARPFIDAIEHVTRNNS